MLAPAHAHTCFFNSTTNLKLLHFVVNTIIPLEKHVFYRGVMPLQKDVALSNEKEKIANRRRVETDNANEG